MDRLISTMKNHIIVCGAGRVGSNVIDQLRYEKQPFVVIESNLEIYEQLVDQKIPVIHGDATLDEVLLRVGVEKAKRDNNPALSDDAHNVYVTLTAKSLNPKLTHCCQGGTGRSPGKTPPGRSQYRDFSVGNGRAPDGVGNDQTGNLWICGKTFFIILNCILIYPKSQLLRLRFWPVNLWRKARSKTNMTV